MANSKNPLAAYRRTWVCRLGGHMEALNQTTVKYKEPMGYCRRCFLPTSAKLVEEMESFRELVRQAQAIQDLQGMVDDASP